MRLLQALMVIAPLLYSARIQDASNLPKVAFIQLMAMLLMIGCLVRAFLSRQLIWIKNPVLILVSLWLAWSGLSVFWAINHSAGLILWMHWLACFMILLVITLLADSIRHIETLVLTAVLSGTIIAAIGCFQYISGSNLIPQFFAPAATFMNKNMAVEFIVMVWPLSLISLVTSRTKHQTLLHVIAHSLILTFILYARTRSAWVAVFLTSVVLLISLSIPGIRKNISGIMSKQNLLGLGISVILILMFSLIPPGGKITDWHASVKSDTLSTFGPGILVQTAHALETNRESPKPEKIVVATPPADSYGQSIGDTILSVKDYSTGSANIRLVLWKNTLKMIRLHFVKGVGLSNWFLHYPAYHRSAVTDSLFSTKNQPVYLHNAPLQIIAETGLIGFGLYAAIFIAIVFVTIRAYKSFSDPRAGILTISVLAAILCFWINSFFSFPLYMAIPPLFLMILIGLWISLVNLNSSKPVLAIPLPKTVFYVLLPLLLTGLAALSWFHFNQITSDHNYVLASQYNALKKIQPALAAASKATQKNPWKHKYWFELAIAAENAGDTNLAQKAYLNALDLHPYHINSLINLSQVYLDADSPVEAEKTMRRALEIFPDYGDLIFNMGILKEKTQRIPEAISHYEHYLAIYPEHAQTHFHLGRIYLKTNNFTKARFHLEKSLSLNADAPKTHLSLGILYDQLNMPEKAFDEYKKVLKLSPETVEAYVNLGILTAKQNKYMESLNYLKKAVHLNPHYGPAQMNLAIVHYLTGDYKSALTHCRLASELGMPRAQVLMRKIESQNK
jgi:tetratricopeptide (TPR) repeat protein